MAPKPTGKPSIPIEWERFKGNRSLIFQEEGNGVIHRIYQVFRGSSSDAADYFGFKSPSAIGKRYNKAGLKPKPREPYTRFIGDVGLESLRSLMRQYSMRVEQALEFSLAPVFGDKSDPYAMLIAMGDIHFGSMECDYDRFLNLVTWIAERPSIGVCLMGDLWDMKTAQGPGVDRGSFTVSWEQCRQMLREDLAPIASQIKFALRGNHDDRVARSTKVDIDPVQWMCEDLGIPYLGYEGYSRARVGEQLYTIYAHHGTGHGQTKGAIFGMGERIANRHRSDMVLVAHRHHLGSDTHTQRRTREDGVVEVVEVPVVFTGSFQRSVSGSYAVERALAPAVCGSATIQLYSKRMAVHPRV